MIINLNTKHGLEVWVNKKLVEEIENEFKKVLNSEELYYYYVPCTCHKPNHSHKKSDKEKRKEVKWLGKISLIDFMKKVQKVDSHFCPIGVTNAPNKTKLLYYFEEEMYSNDPKYWDYWIGDVVNQDMVCGDNLVISLWNRVRDKATKDATTRKRYTPFE